MPIVVLALVASSLAAPPSAGDSAGAERQLLIARRLAASGSPDAEGAFLKVVELDPEGALADDALVEAAIRHGLPDTPDGLGNLSADDLAASTALLDRVVRDLRRGDRLPEAEYRLGLAKLEPGAGRDAGEARAHLLAAATAPAGGRWELAARYALGWLEEQEGDPQLALATYQRLLVDHPGSGVAAGASAGAGRLRLRLGDAGAAAADFQEAYERFAEKRDVVAALREDAVRVIRRNAFPGSRWSPPPAASFTTGTKGAVAMVRLPDGTSVVADRRGGGIATFDAGGRPTGRVALDEVQALAVDPLGRAFVAAGERIFLLRNGNVLPVASQGSFSPAGAIAVDAAGRIYLTDRRGDRIGRVAPGGAAPSLLRERRGASLSALAWSGNRLLALEERTGRVLEIRRDGTDRPAVTLQASSATALAVDAAGRLAIADSRADVVTLVGADGSVVDRLPLRGSPIGRVAALAFGADGTLDVLDASTGAVVRLP